MKKLISLLLVSTLPLFALEDIEKLLVKKAETPEQKKVVKEYLLTVAKDHRDLAKKYRQMAVATKGGKAVYQNNKKEEMLELAQQFESDAKLYEDEANNLK